METKEDAGDAIHKVPSEIIEKILAYLPSTALKQARLVNRKWSDASKNTMWIKNSQFLFRGFIYPKEEELKEFFDTLENGCFRYLSLKFIRTELDDVFETFVSSHGAQICSLSFIYCSFTFSTMKTIMLNCVNLKRLEFVDCSVVGDHLEFSIDDDRKIVCNSLKILKIVDCNWLSLDFLSIVLDLYPCIEKLKITIYDPTDDFFYTVSEKCQKIRELELDVDDPWVNEALLHNLSSLWYKLKHLTVPIFPLLDITEQFITQYTNITSMDFTECRDINVELFEFILRNNINLEYLKIRVKDRHGTNRGMKNILKLLAESRLKSLNCLMFVEIVHQPEELISDIPLNYTLERLTVCNNCFTITNCFFRGLLKKFRNITYLDLYLGYPKDIFTYIFENMVNLKSLEITCTMSFMDDSVFSNCQLFSYLEDFTIQNCHGLTERVIEKFHNFPRLKALKLKNCDTIKESGIAQIPTILPLLEYLDIDDAIISKHTLFQICQQLKYLKDLRAQGIKCVYTRNNESVANDSIIKDLIIHCPSLRVAAVNNQLYYYNHLRKKMMKIKRNDEGVFFATEV